jgi:hypothetical protein
MYSRQDFLSRILIYYLLLLPLVQAQNEAITFEFNTTTGLVYFLIVFFFMFNFGTPVARFIYVRFLMESLERASNELKKISKRVSDRMSDAGRKVSQSIRSN